MLGVLEINQGAFIRVAAKALIFYSRVIGVDAGLLAVCILTLRVKKVEGALGSAGAYKLYAVDKSRARGIGVPA